jgi:hypothetical protein
MYENSKSVEIKTPKFPRIFFSSSLEKQATLIVPLLNILKAAGKRCPLSTSELQEKTNY